MPCAPALLGAAPDGKLPGDGTLIKAGWVTNEPQPVGTKLEICWRGLMVLVSLSAVHNAASSRAPVGAVAVLLLTANTFSKKYRAEPVGTSAAAVQNRRVTASTALGLISNNSPCTIL